MDHELAERARLGDHDAFAALVGVAVPRLHAVASIILGDRDLAADAVQDACISAWRNIRGLREPERVDAWLHRLVVRACYQQARHDRRRKVVELRVAPLDEPVTAGPETSSIARDEMERGFRRLPIDQRAVLVLHHYLGMTLDETAEVLDIPPGTARSRMNRAVGSMRAALEADARPTALAKESN